MLTGTASVDKPLRISPNNNLILHHLRKINIKSKKQTLNIFNLFNEQINFLNLYLLKVYYNDPSILFMYSMRNFMRRLSKINVNFLNRLLIKANLVYVESAKMDFQRKKITFNSIHVIDKCGY